MSTGEQKRIAAASALALGVAALLLLTVVLPSEYGWDPMGTGETLGLLGMADKGSRALTAQEKRWREDRIELPLAPFESVEYKYRLAAGDALLYHWQTSDNVLFDMHAEPDGAAPGYAESFEKAQGSSRSGSYVAPFSGIHGWFWQNRSQRDVVITLETSGFYSQSREFRDGREFIYDLTTATQQSREAR